MHVKDLFVPKLVDNSPRGWVRFAGQTVVQTAAINAGMYIAIMMAGATYALWNKKIEELETINKYQKEQIETLEAQIVSQAKDA